MKLFNPSSAMARTPVVHAGCSANAPTGKGGVFENRTRIFAENSSTAGSARRPQTLRRLDKGRDPGASFTPGALSTPD
jgi:hypothetical protein